MTQFNIGFDANVNIIQTITLNDGIDLTPQQVIDGLNNGTLVTTISFDKNQPSMLLSFENNSLKPIGEVTSQGAGEFCHYENFELSE